MTASPVRMLMAGPRDLRSVYIFEASNSGTCRVGSGNRSCNYPYTRYQELYRGESDRRAGLRTHSRLRHCTNNALDVKGQRQECLHYRRPAAGIRIHRRMS
jgi:hypothetical protein